MDRQDPSTSLPCSIELTKSIANTRHPGSHSMQSHLSVTNSQRRLRVSASYNFYPTKLSAQSQGLVDGTNTAVSFFDFGLPSLLNSWLQHLDVQLPHQVAQGHPRQRSWHCACWKWAAFLYGFLCVIFMSVCLVQHVQGPPLPPSFDQLEGSNPPENQSKKTSYMYPGSLTTSYLDALPTSERLSRLTSIYPQPIKFDPFVLRAEDGAVGPTACLWCLDQDLKLLPAWASKWRGVSG
jgi:hypothetical protein